ncbi:MAG: DEAD/DEAH box helicase family protein [Methylococcaceae bacterium]|nr:DEAD/DEAH box helicase family protein [Methylococcaceae bacterium]
MNEAETRADYIDPALAAAGWGVVDGSRIRREYSITLGRIEGHGKRGKALTADYVLEYRNTKLAVVEAKAWDKPLTEGVGQAKDYAGKLAVRFTYASNGQGVYGIDMDSGVEGELVTFPSPDELWNRTFAVKNAWRDRFAAVPFEDRGGYFQGRYYQDIAVERVLHAIADGQDRILLTLATGTGKTFIAFQLAWKLFQSRWNLGDWRFDTLSANGNEPTRRPRILFLADRNILANQAFNAFSAFPEDALVRIEPADIRKKGKVPKNGSLFFTIFQTFMSGPASNTVRPELVEGHTSSVHGSTSSPRTDEELIQHESNLNPVRGELAEPHTQHESNLNPVRGELVEPHTQLERNFYFGDYPPDFFDFIVIDECHRGGANDESNWRGILDYFSPAVQLGLTATPKRKDNVDTYAYFGEPVFIYSLKDGINDGFLTPFRVKQIATTMDDYVFTSDDTVVEGEIEAGKRYEEKDFNKIIEIKERELKRVEIFMSQIDQREKTLVFCANQGHALLIRDLINQVKSSTDPNYCQRVTANDGALGDEWLRNFQDNEKSIPTILTTSQKLSTGVDARNVRNIVLLRPVNSMIEFKQIIGRGTRLYDGKDYFTIYDFVRAHHRFSEPDWDGEPVDPEVCSQCGCFPCRCEKALPKPCAVCNEQPCQCEQAHCEKCAQHPCVCKKKKAKVKLADGKERTIQHMTVTSFWHPDGTPMSAAQFLEALFGKLPEFFKDEAELRNLWSMPDTRKKLLEGLAENGFGKDQLDEIQKVIEAENSDLFDVLAHVAYALTPISREQRAGSARVEIGRHFDYKQQAFLDFVLSHYVSVGVEELDQAKLTPLLRLKYHNSIADAVTDLGKPEEIGRVFAGFQKYLYQFQTGNT